MSLKYRALLIAALSLSFCLPARTQSVDEILSKNVQAHGGLEKIKSLTSLKITGKISAPSAPQIAFTIQKKRPNFLRIGAKKEAAAVMNAIKTIQKQEIDENTLHLNKLDKLATFYAFGKH